MNVSSLELVLTRGVDKILPSRQGLERLMGERKITLYQGFDPTAKSLHIGHFIGIRKLAQFQALGHKAIFVIGDGTGLAGDPSGRTRPRDKFFTKEELVGNAEGYKDQVSKIIRFDGPNPARLVYNSEWLGKLKLADILKLSDHFTLQQMIERDLFQKRIKAGEPIKLREFMYPLLQGYDSAVLGVDLEIGGTDQLFNMMAGRTLTKTIKGKEKYVLTMKLLADAEGRKMGKSEGNAISLTDRPEEIFGRIMSMPDQMMGTAAELLTDLPIQPTNKNPMETKKRIAHAVVSQIHGEANAGKAQEYFEKTFQRGSPDFAQVIKQGVLSSMVASASNVGVSQAKRLIGSGAVDINGKAISDFSHIPEVGDKIKIGKKTFVTVVE